MVRAGSPSSQARPYRARAWPMGVDVQQMGLARAAPRLARSELATTAYALRVNAEYRLTVREGTTDPLQLHHAGRDFLEPGSGCS
jgi:hypothetical protein